MWNLRKRAFNHFVNRILIGNKRTVQKSLVEVAEVREVTLITAARMSKERRLSLKKANLVEVIYVRGRGRGFLRGHGRTDGAPRGGGNEMSFCMLWVNKESHDGIESIYQSKTDSSFNSDSKVKEGFCYFLKSRLPTDGGTVNGRKVDVLRNTGCTCCTVKRTLVSDVQLIGKEYYVTLIDGTTQKYPLAVIDINYPFFTGNIEALCMEDTLYDLVIGNIDGSELPDMSHFSAAAVTRSQAKQSEKAYRKLQVPGQIMNEDKEALKQAQATDPNLDSIRGRVESGTFP